MERASEEAEGVRSEKVRSKPWRRCLPLAATLAAAAAAAAATAATAAAAAAMTPHLVPSAAPWLVATKVGEEEAAAATIAESTEVKVNAESTKRMNAAIGDHSDSTCVAALHSPAGMCQLLG